MLGLATETTNKNCSDEGLIFVYDMDTQNWPEIVNLVHKGY